MYLAIDIGGTKTLLGVFTAQGRLLESAKIETPKEYSAFLEKIEKTFHSLTHNDRLKLCVAGAPGKINRMNRSVLAFGNLGWEDISIGKDIQKICKIPTLVENDANLAGLSEATLIRHNYKKVLYVTISTGIGGSLIMDGKIKPEFADMEIGLMMFEHNGKLQYWEEFASGKAVYNKFGVKFGDIPTDDHGKWYEISRNLALGMSAVIANLTPEVIVIGGGAGTHFDKFADRLHEELLIFGSKLVSVPPIRKAIRTEEAVIYGCYEFARQSRATK